MGDAMKLTLILFTFISAQIFKSNFLNEFQNHSCRVPDQFKYLEDQSTDPLKKLLKNLLCAKQRLENRPRINTHPMGSLADATPETDFKISPTIQMIKRP